MLLGAVVVGVVLRGAWAVYATRRPETFGDPFAYLNHAEDIARGDGYRTFFVGAPTAYYPVGYPALLGGALWLVHLAWDGATTTGVASALNIAAGAATIGLVYATARSVLGRRIARIAAVVTAVFPGLVLYAATAHYESVLAALVALLLWLTVGRGALVPKGRTLAVLGAVLGVAVLVRPIVGPFVLVVAAVWRRAGWRRSLGAAATVGAIAALVVVPWSVRSTRAMGGFVLVSTNTGDNLCIGHSAFSKGHYHGLAETCWQGFDDVPAERLEIERDRENARRAGSYARRHPGREVVLLARKAYYLVEHDHEGLLAVESYGAEPFLDPALRRTLRVIADGAWYVIAAAAAGGAVLAWRVDDPRLRVALGFTAVLLGTPLLFFGGARFHVPAAPLLALLSAVAIDQAATAVTSRRQGRRGRPSRRTAGRAPAPTDGT